MPTILGIMIDVKMLFPWIFYRQPDIGLASN